MRNMPASTAATSCGSSIKTVMNSFPVPVFLGGGGAGDSDVALSPTHSVGPVSPNRFLKSWAVMEGN